MAVMFLLMNVIVIITLKFIISSKQRARILADKNKLQEEKTKIEEMKKTAANQMLSYVNHEVRNPLNVIKGLSSLTLDNLILIGEKQQDIINLNKENYDMIVSDLNTVIGNCLMIEHVVGDILDIRKLEAGKLALSIKRIYIHEFLNNLIKSFSQKMNENPAVKLLLDYDRALYLETDPFRLKQIILNYVTNAMKYTVEGSITIKVEKTPGYVRFSVIDTGRGIKDESKELLFSPFHQVNADDAIRHNGIGLGLHLCKMLAQCMDGRVGFTSEYKKGSTFWVEFKDRN